MSQQQEEEKLRRQREEAKRLRQDQEAANQPKGTESVNDSKLTIEDNSQLQVFEFEVVTVNVPKKWWGLGTEITLNCSSSQAQYFTEDLGQGVELEMVYIPGGELMMGTDEKEISG